MTMEPGEFSHITLSGRPLIVCDIDEVVLQFIDPFKQFLLSEGHDLLPRSFKLTGNVVSTASGEAVPADAVKALLEAFFCVQESWQTPVPQVCDSLANLSAQADIIFLTAMSPRHVPMRRALLDRHGLPYPLLATEHAKGPLLARLLGETALPTAFIDDLAPNLHSVRDSVPGCVLINMMADEEFRRMAPQPGEGILSSENWAETETLLRNHLLLQR